MTPNPENLWKPAQAPVRPRELLLAWLLALMILVMLVVGCSVPRPTPAPARLAGNVCGTQA